MAAYGAVISLLQTLDTVGELQISLDRSELESLREKVSFLRQFLENPLRKFTSDQKAHEVLETEIRDGIFKAENFIESHIYNLLAPGKEYRNHLWRFLFFAVKNVVLLVLVPSLFHFAIRDSMPVYVQNWVYFALRFWISINIVVICEAFLQEVWAKLKSIFARIMMYSSMQDVLRNSRPEAQDLGQVIKEVESIANEVVKIKNKYGAEDPGPTRNLLPAASSSRGDSDVTRKNVVVGFDGDLEEIRTRLASDFSKVETVPIVGMGGSGKTTLARLVYDDSYIVYHFDIRAWVTISQEYSLRQVLVALLDSAQLLKENMYEKREEELALCLYKSLKGRRYFIVVDDMWDIEIWDAMRRLLPEDNNGSRVLLTTRLSEVALYANSGSSLHRMRFLNERDSWKLMCNKVFGGKDQPLKLEEIGKEIARNCGGLPLAVAVIGGFLSKVSRTQEHWRNVADNLNSIVAKDDKQCMAILSLSYNHLPHRLRPCFLYMGVFPEDYEIPVSKLICLWAAEGFLEPHRSKSLEELAEECLEDLIERNLIFASERSSNGKIKTCKIHDLLRIMCIQRAHKENYLYVVKCEDDVFRKDIKNSCRLSIHPNILSVQSEILYKSGICSSSTRSVLCAGEHFIFPSRVYLRYRLLRVLDLAIVYFLDFPAEIIKLVNLRYLAFTHNQALPSSISKLCNLQTLVHYYWIFGQGPIPTNIWLNPKGPKMGRVACPFLPVEIWLMPKLRHLRVTPSRFSYPLDVQNLEKSSLENLQTLSDVRNFRCDDNILKRIPNIKKLGISYDISPSAVWSEYQLEDLVNLHQLETLKLLIKEDIYHKEKFAIPPNLAFPQKLKKLTLIGCVIPWRSMTIVGALPNLEVLKLRSNACKGTDWEPLEEQFSRLKYLLLEKLDLVQWRADETHFPCLQRLIIRSCFKLKEIPSGIGDIPTLASIELVNCHPSAVTSARLIEEEQQSNGNVDLKVHVELERRAQPDKFYFRCLL